MSSYYLDEEDEELECPPGVNIHGLFSCRYFCTRSQNTFAAPASRCRLNWLILRTLQLQDWTFTVTLSLSSIRWTPSTRWKSSTGLLHRQSLNCQSTPLAKTATTLCQSSSEFRERGSSNITNSIVEPLGNVCLTFCSFSRLPPLLFLSSMLVHFASERNSKAL